MGVLEPIFLGTSLLHHPFFYLMPTLGWMGLSFSTLGEDPLKDMGTSSM
jgi:hypothetical protein